jgi:hypothetical protein
MSRKPRSHTWPTQVVQVADLAVLIDNLHLHLNPLSQVGNKTLDCIKLPQHYWWDGSTAGLLRQTAHKSRAKIAFSIFWVLKCAWQQPGKQTPCFGEVVARTCPDISRRLVLLPNFFRPSLWEARARKMPASLLISRFKRLAIDRWLWSLKADGAGDVCALAGHLHSKLPVYKWLPDL